MKRGFFCVLLCLVTLLCGPVRAEQKIELKFWHAMGGGRTKILNELIDRFNQKNPDVKVIGVHIQSRDPRMGNDYHALYQAIMENLALKTPPDIAQTYENWTAQWIDIGALVPIGDFKDGSDDGDLIPIFRDANTYNGKLWTLPFNKSIYVLFYNKDMFKSAGVQPPATWDEFREAAKKLTLQEGENTVRYGVAFKPSVDVFGHYLVANGGSFLEGNKTAFNTPVGVQDLEFWVGLIHKDKCALASFNDLDEFKEGRSAMYFDSTSRLPYFNGKIKFELGVAMLPKGSTQKYQFAGTNLAVFSHLNTEKKAAAVKFVRFMTGKESAIYWAINTGYLPVRKSAVDSPEYQKLIKDDPRYKVGIDALKYAVMQPKASAWEMIRGIVDDTMFDVVSLRSAPGQALEKAASMSDRLMSNLTGQR